MRGAFAGILIAFVALSLAFGLVEALRSRTRRQPIFRRGYLTDVLYWLFTPVVTRSVVTIAVAVAAAPVALLIYGRVDREAVLAGYGPLSRLPLWQQAIGCAPNAALYQVPPFQSPWPMRRSYRRS